MEKLILFLLAFFAFPFLFISGTSALFIILIIIVIIIIVQYMGWTTSSHKDMTQEHFLITGGSSGIGLAFALEAATGGASVTIVARNEERLEIAKRKLLPCKTHPKQVISALKADVTSSPDILQNVVNGAVEKAGPITFLVNCAGTSVCYRFEETPHTEFQRMMNTNFMGSVNLTQVVVPLMKKEKRGNIIFVSSMAGLIGLYGYSAYSASKFALVGMAEALQMEVKPYNITVTVSFPPDTNTPGYEEEIKTKLTETRLVSESGGLYSAKDVAVKTLADAKRGRFMSVLGFEGWFVATACCGMTSVSSIVDVIVQVLCMGFCRIGGCFYLQHCDKVINQCVQNKVTDTQS